MSAHETPSSLPRRDFLRIGVAAGAGLAAGALAAGAATPAADAARPAPPAAPATMPTRNLGRTGHRVGIFSLGGQAALEKPDNAAVAVPLIERALDLGVNYIDTAAWYGREERWSQRYIGEVMKRRRSEVFLASKTHDLTRDGSLRLLEDSLRLLNTDHLDLWQVHRLGDVPDHLEAVFGKGGVLEAMLAAREQGLVRFLGITGHSEPGILMEAIRRFDFDNILLALNAADPHHLSFERELLPLAVERRMGIVGMKIPARGRILSSWTPPPPDPQRPSARPARPGTLTMREAFDYVLSLPVSTVIIGCDSIAQLEENVALARTFTPLSEAQMAGLVSRAEPVHRQALFFRRWA
jgi:hypothetical protein